MKTTARWLALGVVGVCVSCSQAGDKYLADKDGRMELKQPVVLKDSQSGAAGTSVAEWKIEQDGQWRYREYSIRNETPAKTLEDKSGVLTQDQLLQLGKILEANDPMGLPAKLGEGSVVNPHELTLTVGDAQAKVVGLPSRRGQSLKDMIFTAVPPDNSESPYRVRFAAIAGTVQTFAKGD
jgi:hypothetical protein